MSSRVPAISPSLCQLCKHSKASRASSPIRHRRSDSVIFAPHRLCTYSRNGQVIESHAGEISPLGFRQPGYPKANNVCNAVARWCFLLEAIHPYVLIRNRNEPSVSLPLPLPSRTANSPLQPFLLPAIVALVSSCRFVIAPLFVKRSHCRFSIDRSPLAGN